MKKATIKKAWILVVDIMFAVMTALLGKFPCSSPQFTMKRYVWVALLYIIFGCHRFQLTRKEHAFREFVLDMVKQTLSVIVAVLCYAGLTYDRGWVEDVQSFSMVFVHFGLLLILCWLYERRRKWLEKSAIK